MTISEWIAYPCCNLSMAEISDGSECYCILSHVVLSNQTVLCGVGTHTNWLIYCFHFSLFLFSRSFENTWFG